MSLAEGDIDMGDGKVIGMNSFIRSDYEIYIAPKQKELPRGFIYGGFVFGKNQGFQSKFLNNMALV